MNNFMYYGIVVLAMLCGMFLSLSAADRYYYEQDILNQERGY